MANDITCPYSSQANSSFPSKEYLKRFTNPTTDPMQVHSQFMRAWHDFYGKYSSNMKKPLHLLEFGGGPTIHSLITAAKHVDSITFADYAESNRNEIVMWRDKVDGYHEWSEYFKYVVTELEDKQDNGITTQRQELLRDKIKEVIPCNIRDNKILGERAIEKFDIIHTNLCLEVACESKEEFAKCVDGLKLLLKPGGYLIILTAKGGSWYTCAGTGCKFHQLKMEEDDILEAVKKSGLTICEFYPIIPKKNPLSATREFQFTIARNM